MKIMIIALLLAVCAPSFAAEAPAEKSETEKNIAETPPAQAESQASANATQELAPGEYTCKYYTVKLPAGWKAIVPPEEQLGNVNAIFATDTGSSIVTMVAGPSSGESAETIASMFAEQFKAKKAPVLENGRYTFQFPIQKDMATAYVASYDGNFMMSYIAGDIRQAQKFIREAIKSENWPGLLPR